MKRAISLIMLILGIVMIGIVLVPLLVSQLDYFLNRKIVIIDPSARSASQTPQVLGVNDSDFYSASQWFSNVPASTPTASKVNYYKLSISNLGNAGYSVQIFCCLIQAFT